MVPFRMELPDNARAIDQSAPGIDRNYVADAPLETRSIVTRKFSKS